jgi:tRNA pseudouridine(55) synthase
MIAMDKKRGETLSELVARARREYALEESQPVTYAGRLDPMAEGIVVLLVGEEVKKKDEYLLLEKEYTFDVLFGVSTDTHDILGVIDAVSESKTIETTDVEELLHSYVGIFEQKYPAYSSKPVYGKPLFAHARSGADVELPTHKVELKSIELLGTRVVTGMEISTEAIELIGRVSGDFRQEQCIESWREFAQEQGNNEFQILSFKAVVGSGFYIRVFARDLAQKLGMAGLAFKIRRERVG